MQLPLQQSITSLFSIPYTISFVIRKRQQIDNLNELPKDKRPTEHMIWEGTSDEMEEWMDRVFDRSKSNTTDLLITDVEG